MEIDELRAMMHEKQRENQVLNERLRELEAQGGSTQEGLHAFYEGYIRDLNSKLVALEQTRVRVGRDFGCSC